MKRDRYIYKVLTLEQWGAFQRGKVFKGSPADLSDGYIHLSCACLLYTSPSPRDQRGSRMPSSA